MSEAVSGLILRKLPPAFPDDRDNEKSNRFARYGEQFSTGIFGTSDHIMADEGSYLVASNTAVGTGQTWVAAQTTFVDTTPNWYIENTESPNNQDSKWLYLRFLKMISTAVATGTTLIRYAAILDNVPRALSTDNTASITSRCYRGDLNPLVTPTVKVQNSATASVIAASSGNKRIVANGTLGGLNVIGTEMQINFGSTDAGGGQNGVAAETVPNRRVNIEGPVIIPPGWSLVIHVWLVGSSASPAPEWTMGLIAR